MVGFVVVVVVVVDVSDLWVIVGGSADASAVAFQRKVGVVVGAGLLLLLLLLVVVDASDLWVTVGGSADVSAVASPESVGIAGVGLVVVVVVVVAAKRFTLGPQPNGCADVCILLPSIT